MPQAAVIPSRSARFRPKSLNSQDILARPQGPRGTVRPLQTSRLFLGIDHGQAGRERSRVSACRQSDGRPIG
jgi:hypothetical protein